VKVIHVADVDIDRLERLRERFGDPTIEVTISRIVGMAFRYSQEIDSGALMSDD
jgi:hypothetical protein